MSTRTTNLNLIKPELSDPANITAMNENWDKLDQLIYPIGSQYISSTNENPSALFGGTWELVDKGFRSEAETVKNTSEYFGHLSVAQLKTKYLDYIRSGSTLRLRIGLTFDGTISFNDANTSTLTTINLSKLGVKYLPFGYNDVVGTSDGSNGVIMFSLSYDGTLSQTDALSKSGGTVTPTPDEPVCIDITTNVDFEGMIDEFCDKFYWKRTA